MAETKTREYQDFFKILEDNGIAITPEQRKKIESRISGILSYEPRIGFFGKTGVGKSSLCNALFGQDICPISDVEACTRDTKEVLLSLGSKGIKLIDVPGVGESRDRDAEYSKLYQELLPELDVVLWVIKADDRAYTTDQTFYKHVVLPHLDQGKPFFFVLNQADKIEPFREWDEHARRPGPRQSENLLSKVQAVSDYFDVAASKVIPVSAHEKYNLTRLVDEIVFALPKEKQITFVESVQEENVTEEAKSTATDSFSDKVIDFIVDYVPIPPIVKGPIRTAAKKIFNKFKKWLKR